MAGANQLTVSLTVTAPPGSPSPAPALAAPGHPAGTLPTTGLPVPGFVGLGLLLAVLGAVLRQVAGQRSLPSVNPPARRPQ